MIVLLPETCTSTVLCCTNIHLKKAALFSAKGPNVPKNHAIVPAAELRHI